MVCHMAKSVRVSDDLYGLAAAQARLMQRSLAQQIEYWARLGEALERSGDRDAIQRAALSDLHEVERARVRRDRLPGRTLHMIPARFAREAELTFPAGAFDEEDG